MNRQLNSNVLDNLLEGFQLIDFDWRYRYVNESVARQGKSTKEALLGNTMMEKYPGIENTPLFKALEKCMYERRPERIENEFVYPDGTKRWFELRIEPVSEGIFILSIDISERKQAEAALQKLNDSLEEQIALRTSELAIRNKNLTDSLRYARRIQYAKLPAKQRILASLPESFILFKPKAIVSGDFYYFRKKDRQVYIASADCTGHGVPGALMSMLCSEKLHETVAQHDDPSVILNKLNKDVKRSLQQTGNDQSMDGMDIALCSIDHSNYMVKYAGANRPLWLVRRGRKEVEEIKGTRTAIGGFTPFDQHFDTHLLKLKPKDTIYMFSDGYADQFGGGNDKKLLTKRFRQLLLDIQDKKMPEQKRYLANFLENWKSGTEQIDDVLVIGVRL